MPHGHWSLDFCRRLYLGQRTVQATAAHLEFLKKRGTSLFDALCLIGCTNADTDHLRRFWKRAGSWSACLARDFFYLCRKSPIPACCPLLFDLLRPLHRDCRTLSWC